jgi:hypothetical protein
MKNVLTISLLWVLSLTMGAGSADAGKDCHEFLTRNVYECLLTDGVNPPSSSLLQFFFSDALGRDMVAGVTGVFDSFVAPCYCGAKGTLEKPHPEASAGFTCVDDSGAFLMGTAGSKGIKQGTLVAGDSVRFFECTQCDGSGLC